MDANSPYATIDDVFKRYPLVSNVVGSDANLVASADVTSIYIADAGSIIDAYLGRRYTLPLNPEPILTWITSDIAIYRIFEDKLPRFPDAIEKRYTNAMSMLYMLQEGDMVLNASSVIVDGGDQFVWSNVEDNSGVIFRPAEELTNCQSIHDPFFGVDRGGA